LARYNAIFVHTLSPHEVIMRAIATTLAATVAAVVLLADDAPAATGYTDAEGLETALEILERRNARIELSIIATSPGGRDIHLLTVAPAGGAGDTPAVLVVGDPLGTTPLATEAALELARRLVSNTDGPAAALTWYIVPSLDPDGAARFFATPRRADGVNDRPEDDDRDGAVDEDGPDDLDGDGLIASMLLPDPEGAWLLDPEDPRLPREADPAAGEHGLYRLLVEGDDDDGDGRHNEDGPGGALPGRNFPHAFSHWKPRHGPWAASEVESRALMEFAFDHSEIALVLVFGASNTLAAVPGGEATDDPRARKHKPPRWLARQTGLDPQTEYGVGSLLAAVRDARGRRDLSEEDVLGMLNLGPAKMPAEPDRAWWTALAAAYGDSMAAAGLAAPRVAAAPSGSGSVEDWAYYQFGVPAFALDFWSPPLPAAAADSLATAPGDSLAADAAAAPADSSAAGDGVAPELAALAALGDGALDGRGLLPWTECVLRDGTRVLTGGEAPFAMRTPPAARIDSLLAKQLPFVTTLPAWLARLDGLEAVAEHRGGRVWAVTAHVRNGGRIPYPTAQGKRSRRPLPVAVTLEGAEVLEGRARQVIKQVPAMGAASVRWLVRGDPGSVIRVRAEAPGFGADAVGIALQTGGAR